MSGDDKGLSYVPQIRQAYKNLKEAQASKLQLALKLGKLLNDAKQTICADASGVVKKSHGKWMKFREEHFSEISHSTANVYMVLAKDWAAYCEANPNEAGNSQHAVNLVAEGDISIRAAIEKMREAKGGGTGSARASGAGTGKGKGASPDLTTDENDDKSDDDRLGGGGDPDEVIADAAPDEIATVIKREWDEEKRIDLLLALLHDLKPDEIITAIIEALADDAIAKTIGEGIVRQLQTPPQSRPRLQIRRMENRAGA
jgi:hypothetical protein